MVLFTVIWGTPQGMVANVRPSIRVMHPFAGKRVRVRLLSWTGAPTYTGTDSGNLFVPIRIEFDEGFQANGMGAYSYETGLQPHYIYPNCFYVDPISGYEADPGATDPDRQVVGGFHIRHEPTIEGIMVGNVINVTLSSSATPAGVVPDPVLYSYIVKEFYYYKAEFEIEEI